MSKSPCHYWGAGRPKESLTKKSSYRRANERITQEEMSSLWLHVILPKDDLAANLGPTSTVPRMQGLRTQRLGVSQGTAAKGTSDMASRPHQKGTGNCTHHQCTLLSCSSKRVKTKQQPKPRAQDTDGVALNWHSKHPAMAGSYDHKTRIKVTSFSQTWEVSTEIISTLLRWF